MATKTRQTGQAILEFALMITVLLMILFLIIEAARILWAWNQVQNAAREGARYASTGALVQPQCAADHLPKFESTLCLNPTDPEFSAKLRTASIVDVTHDALTGLELDEESWTFEDDNYYDIQIWGVNDVNQFQTDFAGMPSKPVVVRVMYRVPIITPFFRPIAASVPVFGQVTVNNESFGQLGGSSQGQAQPVQVTTPLPTAGVTPSPTPTATNTPEDNPPLPGETPSATPSPTPIPCDVVFEADPVAGNRYVYISGDIGTNVTIQDMTAGGVILGIDVMIPNNGHACDGSADYIDGGIGILSQPLIGGHVLLAEGDDGSFDSAIVLNEAPTITPIPTSTPTASSTPTPSTTPTMTPTPSQPYIVILPDCGDPNEANNYHVSFSVSGYNWPTNQSIALYWDDTTWMQTVSRPHAGNFSYVWDRAEPEWNDEGWTGAIYTVKAVSSRYTVETDFQVPCSGYIPPTATAVPTPTPAPEDLIVVGPPQMIDTPPITAYEPVTFTVMVSNTGDIPVNNLFFIDLFIDPSTPIISTTYSIPVDQSSGYAALSSLAGRTSEVLTITTQYGFDNEPDPHQVYAMVDSISSISEDDETNNISAPLTVTGVITAVIPTATPTPESGGNKIHGVTWRIAPTGLTPILRAQMLLFDSDNNLIDETTSSQTSGYYAFNNMPSGDYTVVACSLINNTNIGAVRIGITLTGSTVVSAPMLLDAATPCTQ